MSEYDKAIERVAVLSGDTEVVPYGTLSAVVFLLDRLKDLEQGWDDEDAYRLFCGHVAPAAARLRSTVGHEE